MHKLNVFHWHLTDDQGWRIEIRRHPELTEHVATPEHATYMIWPRGCAIAEVGWSTRDSRSWDDFRGRMQDYMVRLSRLGVHYRPLDR